MSEVRSGELTLRELAEAAGVTARTVRFYIARGLLPPPLRRGRGARYGPEHLERIRAIRELQRRGLTLAEIGRRLETGRAAVAVAAERWTALRVAEDVTVMVRDDAPAWRRRLAARAAAELAAALDAAGKGGGR